MKKIRANKDLVNDLGERSFTKGREYEIPDHINEKWQLMDVSVKDDQGDPHGISIWYKYFTIIKTK